MYKSAHTSLAGTGSVLQGPCFRCTKGPLCVPRPVRLSAKKIERGYFADVDPNGRLLFQLYLVFGSRNFTNTS